MIFTLPPSVVHRTFVRLSNSRPRNPIFTNNCFQPTVHSPIRPTKVIRLYKVRLVDSSVDRVSVMYSSAVHPTMKSIVAVVALTVTVFAALATATPSGDSLQVARQSTAVCCHYTGVITQGCPDFCPLGYEALPKACATPPPNIACGPCCCRVPTP